MSMSPERLGLWQVAAIGVGGMVSGGIFAVLGLAVGLAVRNPSGGTTVFLDRAFRGGLLSGGLHVLLWLSYVIMLSLYAAAFGSYFSSLVPGDPPGWVAHMALSSVIVALTALITLSAALVGRHHLWTNGIAQR